MSTSTTGALAPLRHAPFRYLAGGRLVTMLGNAVAPIALAFAVLDLTGSAGDLGLVVAARSATMAVFLLFGGVVADRLPRHLVLVGSGVLAGLSQATVAAMVLTGNATVGRLVIFSAVNGLASAFAFPASSALVAQTVPPGIRKQANALNRLGTNSALILGSSLGGVLVAAFGGGVGLAVDASTFVLAAVLFAMVRVPDHRGAGNESAGALRELRVGWREFVAHTWVWVVVLGFCFYNAALVGGLNVLGPVVADHTFGRTAWGLVLAAQTGGMVVGALIAMRLRVRRLLLLGVVGCMPSALLLVALAVTPYTAVLVAAAFLTGLGVEQFGIAWEVSLQEHIPADKLARVYSYDALGSLMAVPVGQVVAGPLADALGIRTALLLSAGVVAVAVFGMLASRDVQRLVHDPAPARPDHTAADPAVGTEPATSLEPAGA
ncbi:MAG TPA: MFS transporter [Micromonosporaceae bacterium]|nr:MFS transporter [Micromonosporaceae bacterium]